MRRIIPIIAGDADIPNEGHVPFTNFASITGNMTVNPNPDFFDGVLPEAIDQEVREALDSIIIPTRKAGVPIAPNLFLEAKGTGGSVDVGVGQVVLNGAHGSLLMLELQNHLLDSPVFDGNAYTFSALFLGGFLKLYAHHPACPDKPGKSPSYHITQLNAYALTGNHESWLEGIGAFRNLRFLAKKYRDQFINAANERSRKQRERTSADGIEDSMTDGRQGNDSSPSDFFDCLPFAEASDEYFEDFKDTRDTNFGLAIDHQICSNDEDESQLETSTAYQTSFATNIAPEIDDKDCISTPRQLKLPHSPPSPPSPRNHKKRGVVDR